MLSPEQQQMLDVIEEEKFTIPNGNDADRQEYKICNSLVEIGLLRRIEATSYGVSGIVFFKPFPLDNGI